MGKLLLLVVGADVCVDVGMYVVGVRGWIIIEFIGPCHGHVMPVNQSVK